MYTAICELFQQLNSRVANCLLVITYNNSQRAVYTHCQPLFSNMRTRRWFPHILCFAHAAIVTLPLITYVTLYITIFWQKWYRSPNRQKSPKRQAKHKPNAEPSKDDSYIVWTGSVNICRSRCILKKSLLTN